ncbi:hypothetical protein Poli38472_007321 [Pythium oligandrum]|uniref:FYVE-type domain-containing protein n=1 Tax=Pythium oligandrum TaxID=41045 RepID=A0A8K1FE94_PYTOL|nr:hypothetical protein Poli38472_007321 [Pythium oligandrum]|eukprot:TMW59176.1 hypothetical protein Poli38472_007321 [Pythium oligandrum]
MSVELPLPDNYFPPVILSRQEAAKWKQQVTELVQLSLEEEAPVLAARYELHDADRWKLIKEREQLRVYQPRRSSRLRKASGSTPNMQAVMAIGTLDGTIEDAIYGVHQTNSQDFRASASFLNPGALDAALLHVFECGTLADPYRSLALKWRVIQTSGTTLIKNRDGCVLEYIGIDRDSNGRRYAFHISESVDTASCPSFHPKAGIIRADCHTRVIYRQISPGRIGIYFRGEYAPGGHIAGIFARKTVADIALSVGRSVACAQAKRLTTLAFRTSPIFQNRVKRRELPHNECSICSKRPSVLSTKSMTWCKICGAPVCTSCRSRKPLLAEENKKVRVSCCKQCIVAAKNLKVDPLQPLELVPAAKLKKHGAGILSSSSSSTGRPSPTSQQSYTSYTSEDFNGLGHGMSTYSICDDFAETPLSNSTYSGESDLNEEIVLLESTEMTALREEDEGDADIPTLGALPADKSRGYTDSIQTTSQELSTYPQSTFAPPTAQRGPKAMANDRLALYTQMLELREKAEDIYSMTQANAILGRDTLAQSVVPSASLYGTYALGQSMGYPDSFYGASSTQNQGPSRDRIAN